MSSKREIERQIRDRGFTLYLEDVKDIRLANNVEIFEEDRPDWKCWIITGLSGQKHYFVHFIGKLFSLMPNRSYFTDDIEHPTFAQEILDLQAPIMNADIEKWLANRSGPSFSEDPEDPSVAGGSMKKRRALKSRKRSPKRYSPKKRG
jgi:hypothetical protein